MDTNEKFQGMMKEAADEPISRHGLKERNLLTPVWWDMECTRLIILKAIVKFNYILPLGNFMEVKK